MSESAAGLAASKKVIVCCGAGGVGKTSVACALAVLAARRGRRVLAVTIDPSRRLAETLGVAPHCVEPIRLTEERLRAAGISPPGSLDAWVLDPQVVSDRVVRRFSKDPAEARRLLDNRMYRNITAMVAGMQEYTAVEAMHGFVTGDEYDLVVLDTPPSRNALHFLEAPKRVSRFLDGRVFRFFLPDQDAQPSMLKRAASKITAKVMDIAFGEDTRVELMDFFALFSAILKKLNHNAGQMREFFQKPEVAFLVVTSPTQEALEEALYFEHKTRDELELPLSGYILNRSLAQPNGKRFPGPEISDGSPLGEAALRKLSFLAERELALTAEHRTLLNRLQERLGEDHLAQAAPLLRDGVSDLATLSLLADALATLN